MTPVTSRIAAPPYLGRLSDLTLAQKWLESVSGELHYAASVDSKTGEFFTYEAEPQMGGGKRVKIRYLAEATVEARLLAFLVSLCDQGASIRVTPGKIRSVKTLAGLLMLQQEGGAK